MVAKARILYWVNILMAISFILVGYSGIVKFGAIYLGASIGLGLSRYTWTIIHDYSGVALVILVLIHLILNWAWLVAMTKSLFKKH